MVSGRKLPREPFDRGRGGRWQRPAIIPHYSKQLQNTLHHNFELRMNRIGLVILTLVLACYSFQCIQILLSMMYTDNYGDSFSS